MFKKIFIKNHILESLEEENKGNLGTDLKLKLQNGLTYQLTPAIKFTEKLEGESRKQLSGKFFTHEELSLHNYDIYMDTAIIDETTVYSFEQGFSGVLIDNNTILLEKQIEDSIKEHAELKTIMTSMKNSFVIKDYDSAKVNLLLKEFINKLGTHIKRENEFLYKNIDKNPKLKALTKTYISSLGVINTIISEYYNKWSNNIFMVNRELFWEETKDIIRILKDRIKQEETNLFITLLKK